MTKRCGFRLSLPSMLTACACAAAVIAPWSSAAAETKLPMNGDCTYFSEVFRIHQRQGHIPPRPAPEGVRAFIADESNLTITDVTPQIGKRLIDPHKMRVTPFSYDELLDYYRRQLTLWQRTFPERSIRIVAESVLGRFRDKTHLSMSEAFRIPFAPISADIDEPMLTNFFKITGTYKGKKILGMRTKILLLRAPKELCPQTIFLQYMPDINARMLGYSHAQLIPELSENVMPAFAFEYNGLHSWKEHSRLKERDQLSHPIALTNFAHLGRSYVVSGHPDFSLMLESYEAPSARMTFFLWRAETKITAKPPDLETPPDFVYQIDLAYRDSPPTR